MSADDAARYNQWSADCANGTHNNFPGLKDADIAAWKFGDAKLADASAMAKIDSDALLALRGESVKISGDGVASPNMDSIATDRLKAAGRKAGYSDAVIDRYVESLESDVYYDIEQKAKTQWGKEDWDNLSLDDQQLLKDIVSNKEQTDEALAEAKHYGKKTILEYRRRYNQGMFDSKNYTLDDILTLKMDRNAAPKSYAGIRNAEFLPRADEFISNQRVVDYVKELCPDNKSISNCTNLQELADVLSRENVKIELVTFQDASVDGANILSFGGNFGNVSANVESGGGTFCIPKSKLIEYADTYSDICSYEDGEFKIFDIERFGDEVLSGVQFNEDGGVYMISTVVPIANSNIGMPSVNNWSSYMAYFVSGGKLLSGELEITQKPLPDIISDAVPSGKRDLVGIRNGVDYIITVIN
jgi:hypothetical protein